MRTPRSGQGMAIIGFHHAAISTPNLERSVAFYRDVFGFETVFEFEWAGVDAFDRMMAVKGTAARVVMLRTGNSFLELFEFSSPAPAAGSERPVIDHGFTHICVAVDDAVAECARLESLGVRLHCPVIKSALPVAGTYGRDPDGNALFEILEVRDPSHPLAFFAAGLAALKEIPA